jgi:hypothetical protein
MFCADCGNTAALTRTAGRVGRNDAREASPSGTAISEWKLDGGVTTDAATVGADPAN